MHTIVIDTDPGHDDAIAIFLALAYPECCRVRGITTVAGNQTLAKVTANARKLLSFVGRPLPVAAGAAAPLERPLTTAGAVHGESGLGGVELPPATFELSPMSAGEFLLETFSASAAPMTLVSLGPETNIATLIRAHPEVRDKIGLISLMGGGIAHGNRTMAAEFNIYADPEAARIVFRSGVPIVMSGLDVTEKAFIEQSEIDALGRGGKVSRLVADLIGFYAAVYRTWGVTTPALHDPCAVAYLIQPDLFRFEEMFVDVETAGEITRGMTVADRRPGRAQAPNLRVLIDVDRNGFIELLREGLSRLDRELGSS